MKTTKNKNSETLLPESEKRFRMVVEQAGDAFFIHDYNGLIIDVNRQACESLNYSRKELIGMKISEIDIEVSKKKHRMRYWEKLSPSEYITFEGVHQRKDRSTFPVEVRLGRLDIGENRLLLSLVRDIADRKRAENDLKKAFEKIKELKDKLELENIHLHEELILQYKHNEIIGESKSIKQVLSRAEKVAAQTSCVLITGETGTGKELFSRAIHNMSPRKGRSMVQVNCATLPSGLIESELFGREKGAYTGAVSKRIGRFEAAHKTTIFLDEIGDLPLELQPKLLRVLQEGQFERVGSNTSIKVDVRVIVATNKDLEILVREGKFREDLYYRLNVFPITIPPLRQRREDIPLLVWTFVNEFAESMGKPIKVIPKKIMEKLRAYDWPGNIRELRNVIERAMILSAGTSLRIDEFGTTVNSSGHELTLDNAQRNHILQVLEKTDWRVSGNKGAARILNMNESTLRSKMKKLGITRPE